ncbi:hypothetical protein [Ideonella sp. BN130291]|uniref:hypothetical protein n=1 Tax=Ideonella sp. BN130291 TaxID=3112940 RepID=UPI002E274FFD|nr:hypothetical protein [Ideonella sp. BN130291]
MKALDVDFAAKRRGPVWLGYVAAAVLALIAIQQGLLAWRLQERWSTLQSEMAGLSARIELARQAQRAAAEDRSVEPAYAKDAAALAHVSAFPLDKVFAAVEAARVEGVKVTALEVSANIGTARVDVECVGYDALLKYMAALNAGEMPARWRLRQAQAGDLLRASLESQWN